MAEPKTKPTDVSVADYLNAIKNEQVRQDCWAIVNLCKMLQSRSPRCGAAASSVLVHTITSMPAAVKVIGC